MKRLVFLFSCFVLLACTNKPAYKTIGISIDQDDRWRQKLCLEIAQEANKYPNVRLLWCQAGQDLIKQRQQIDSLAQVGADLIIISTDAPAMIEPAVDNVFGMGIPVIVSTKTNVYTAFIGTDNQNVGALLGQHVLDYAVENNCSVLNPLEVIEIEGIPSESSAYWRHEGIMNILHDVPFVKLYSVIGNWNKEQAYTKSDSLLRLYPNTKVIVAHNDIMAHAAYRAAKTLYPENEYYILGVDAITDGGEGLESIISGEINASVTNYSRGDLMIQTAYKILTCQPYERNYYVPSEIVNHSSQSLMNRMANEITGDKQNIHFLSGEVNRIGNQANQLRMVVFVLIGSLCVIIVLFITILCFSHTRLRKQMERAKNTQLKYQQHQIDVISAELNKVKTQQNLSDRFITNLKKIMLDHIEDPSFNVDQMSKELGVSRAQLFRKVKSYVGITPIELMQQLRMKKAQRLLQETDLSIQQIAYSVGIQSPSYFTLQYKKMFGILPTKEHRGSGT